MSAVDVEVVDTVESIEPPPPGTTVEAFLAQILVELQSEDATHIDVEVYSAKFRESSMLRITLVDKPRAN